MNTLTESENRRQMMQLIKYKSRNTEFYILARLRGIRGGTWPRFTLEFHHPWTENQSRVHQVWVCEHKEPLCHMLPQAPFLRGSLAKR